MLKILTTPFSTLLLLARRFVFSKSSDGFLSFISWVSVVGVALGVLALVVVTSVINGFEGELIRVITGMNGDLILYSKGEPISDAARIEEKVKKMVPETQAITHSLVSELMVSGSQGVAGAILEGVDRETLASVTETPSRFESGEMPGEAEIALGKALAERIGAGVGEEIRLIAPFTGSSDPDSGSVGAPKVLHLKVSGIFRMGMHEYDSKFMLADLKTVQTFLEQPDRVSTFKIKLAPGSDSRLVSDRLSDSFGYPFRAKDWSQMNRNLFYAIKLEKAVIAIILTVIVIVAAFNVVSTLMMMIHDKTKEIAILKAMGMPARAGFTMFSWIGMAMGLVGAACGVGLGLLCNEALERTRLIDLPADIYYIGYLPVVTRWFEVGLIVLVALLISFLATLYPAWKVAKYPPLEGLRYE